MRYRASRFSSPMSSLRPAGDSGARSSILAMKYPRNAGNCLRQGQLSATCEAEATPARRSPPQRRKVRLARAAATCLTGRADPRSASGRRAMAQDYVQRFFGGPPLAVIGRLILLSILVGVILAAIGLDPWNIIDSVRRLVWHLWNMGFDAVRWLWQYFLLGAVIVLPIWLLVRLAKAPRGG